MNTLSSLPRPLLAVCSLALAGLLTLGQAHAQQMQQPEGQPAPEAQQPLPQMDDDVLALEMELIRLHQRLEEIQQAALQSNPELEQQAEQLGALMVSVMEEEGFDPQQSIDRIHEIQARLQEPDLDTEEQISLMEEAQAEYLMLEQAQAAAMEQERVQQAHEQFQADVLAAMQEEDPETDEIIAEFTRKHQEYDEVQAGLVAPAPDSASL